VTSRQLRLLRGAGASSVATIIAAVSHTIGGGAAPHPLLVLALSVFLTPIAALLVGRREGVLRLSAAVAVSQTVFHVLFTVLNATTAANAGGTGSAGHQHMMIMLGPIGDTVAPDTGMLSAHIIAGVITVALLARGESVLRAIARWMRAVLHVHLPVPAQHWPSPAPAIGFLRAWEPEFLIGDVSRRGPPALSHG